MSTLFKCSAVLERLFHITQAASAVPTFDTHTPLAASANLREIEPSLRLVFTRALTRAVPKRNERVRKLFCSASSGRNQFFPPAVCDDRRAAGIMRAFARVAAKP